MVAKAIFLFFCRAWKHIRQHFSSNGWFTREGRAGKTVSLFFTFLIEQVLFPFMSHNHTFFLLLDFFSFSPFLIFCSKKDLVRSFSCLKNPRSCCFAGRSCWLRKTFLESFSCEFHIRGSVGPLFRPPARPPRPPRCVGRPPPRVEGRREVGRRRRADESRGPTSSQMIGSREELCVYQSPRFVSATHGDAGKV